MEHAPDRVVSATIAIVEALPWVVRHGDGGTSRGNTPPHSDRMVGEAMPALWALMAAAGITFAIYGALLVGWNTTMRPDRPPQTRTDIGTSLRHESVGTRDEPADEGPVVAAQPASDPSAPHASPTEAASGTVAPRSTAEKIRPARPLPTNVAPVYPLAARQQGLEGVVTLRLDITVSGTVSEVSVVSSSGHAVLDDAARRSVRAWRFVPAQGPNGPVASALDVPIRFANPD